MNKYKKKVLKQLLIMNGLLAVAMIVTISLLISDVDNQTSSFMIGLTFSFIMIVLMISFHFFRICRNPEKMEKEMIKDMDERNVLIQQKVQASSFTVFVIMLAFITIVLAFCNVKLMAWMACLLWLALFVKVLLYWYYKRKL